jgi:hypothetical protein
MWKKSTIGFFLFGVVLLACAGAAHALGVGGLSYNIGPSFSVGAGVSFSQRDVNLVSDDNITDEMTSSRFLIKADVAPIRYVDIYGLIGTSDLRMDHADFQGSLGTMWGVGLRPQVFPLTLQSPINITLDAQYAEAYTADEDIRARLSELQVSLVIAYVMRSIVPYGGVKFDRALVHFSGSDNDVDGDMDWGALIGCDYYVTQNVFFNLELSIFAETAFYLSTGFKY